MTFKRTAYFYVTRNTFPKSKSIKQMKINLGWGFNFL